MRRFARPGAWNARRLGMRTGRCDGLAGDVRQHMSEAFVHGGPPAVQAEMARLSTSDRINNEQAADFMTLASASGHPATLGGLLGIAEPDVQRSGTAGAGSGATPISSQSARSPEPYRPSVTERPLESPPPERSPDVRTRDQAWRGTGSRLATRGRTR